NDQQPSKDWLDFVATGRARSRIRSFLRSKERQRSIKLGRDLFERELRRRDLSLGRFLKSSEHKKLLAHFHAQTTDELFAQVGYGKVSLPQVMEVVAPKDAVAPEELRPSFLERTVRRVTRKDDDVGVQIQGMDGILVRFAKCCNPIAGDAVTG